jgi:hypothetical protein
VANTPIDPRVRQKEKAALERLFYCRCGFLKDSFWLHGQFAIDFSVFIQDNRMTF